MMRYNTQYATIQWQFFTLLKDIGLFAEKDFKKFILAATFFIISVTELIDRLDSSLTKLVYQITFILIIIFGLSLDLL